MAPQAIMGLFGGMQTMKTPNHVSCCGPLCTNDFRIHEIEFSILQLQVEGEVTYVANNTRKRNNALQTVEVTFALNQVRNVICVTFSH